MAQQNGIEKPDLHALPTISDRMTFIYLEHCKVSRENGAVTATDLDGTVSFPDLLYKLPYTHRYFQF